MAGTIVVDRIESDSSYTSTINVASKVNFTGGLQIGGMDTTVGGFRNRIINGAMRIDQRNSGSSITVVGNAASVGFLVDRTYIYNSTGTANTSVTGQQVAVSDANCPFDYAVRATIGNVTSRGSNYDGRFQHNIEGNMVADYVMGTTTMTVTFWARASKSGYAYYAIWSSNAGVGNYLFKRISLTTSWQKYTINIPACSISGAAILKNTGRAFGTGLYWAQSGWSLANDGLWVTAAQLASSPVDDFATNGDWIEFTGYQLEFGSTPTQFEWRSFVTELQLCQRYYQKITGGGNARHAIAGNGSLAQGFPTVFLRQTMRTAPSFSYSNLSHFTLEGLTGGGTATPTSLSLNASCSDSVTIMTQSGGSSTSYAVQLFGSNNSAWTAYDAEL